MSEFDMGLVQRGARLRRSPYYEATQKHSPIGFTVYNHMLFPIRFDTFEAEFEALTTTSRCGTWPWSACWRSAARTA
jgi:hypothetical protein